MSQADTIISLSCIIQTIKIEEHNVDLKAPIMLAGQLNSTKLIDDIDILRAKGHIQPSIIIGVDEAGRGPLLGCVTVAAVILPNRYSALIEHEPLKGTPLSLLTDSKKLSEKNRDRLAPLIKHDALGYIIADIPAAVIDQINILQATMLGMRLCTEALLEALAQQCCTKTTDQAYDIPFEVLFDGNRCPELDDARLSKVGLYQSNIDCQAWIKGDARHTSIAAASVIAKVSRDDTMYKMDTLYPNYAIAKHKGYPTAFHLKALRDLGVTPVHRRSFSPVKNLLAQAMSE